MKNIDMKERVEDMIYKRAIGIEAEMKGATSKTNTTKH